MAENALATWESKMEEMSEAQILQVMGTESGNARVQFLGMKRLVNTLWPASTALNHKRDCAGLSIGTAAHPISPWPEVIHALAGAMETHPDDADVTKTGCIALYFYFYRMMDYKKVLSQRPGSTLFPRVIAAVMSSLRREKPAADHDADTKGMMVLWCMVEVRANMENLKDAGGIGALQSVLFRHPANQKTVIEAYKLLNNIATYYPMELAVSSSMLDSLRQIMMNCHAAGMILVTMRRIANAPPAGLAAADAAKFLEHTQSNIAALRHGLGWILAAIQIHMKTRDVLVFSLQLLTNMAENGGSKDMAQYINECLGFSMVLDGMTCFRFDYGTQLHCAKAMKALLLFGGVETIEEDVKQRAHEMLEVAGKLQTRRGAATRTPHLRIRVHMHAHAYACAYTRTRAHAHMHVHAHMHACAYVYIHVHTHAHVDVRMHARMHAWNDSATTTG